MMTSCAPMPFILSNMPSACRFRLPSMPERRKLVRHHAHRPALDVAGCAIWTIREDLMWRLAFVTGTERAEATFHLHRFAAEVGRTFGAVGRNDDPPSNNRIFAQLRHGYLGQTICYITPPASAEIFTVMAHITALPKPSAIALIRESGGREDHLVLRLTECKPGALPPQARKRSPDQSGPGFSFPD